LLLAVLIAGKFFTGSFLWEYEGKWAQLKTYWPVRLVPFNQFLSITDSVQFPRRVAGGFTLKHIWQHLMVLIQQNPYTLRCEYPSRTSNNDSYAHPD
jgi:hypothetical protein